MRTERFRKRGESSSCGRDHRHTGGQSPPSGCHGLLAFPKQAAFRAQRGHLRRRPSRSTHFGCPLIWRPTPSSRPRMNLAIASYTLESEDVCGPAGRRGAKAAALPGLPRGTFTHQINKGSHTGSSQGGSPGSSPGNLPGRAPPDLPSPILQNAPKSLYRSGETKVQS